MGIVKKVYYLCPTLIGGGALSSIYGFEDFITFVANLYYI